MDAARQLKPFRGARLNRTHPLAKGLVGCWIFNEGSGDKVYDLSGYGNDGDLTNMDPATDWVGGKHGWALGFDGSDDYVSVPTPSGIMNSGTVAAWVKPYDVYVTAIHGIFISGWGVNYQRIYILDYNIGGLHKFYICLGGSTLVNSTYDFLVDTWQHVALSWEGSIYYIYVNGLQVITGTATALDGLSATSRIGGGPGQPNLVFNGAIDSVGIWNRVLLAEEHAHLYREPFCMFEEPAPRSIFIMPGNPWYYYQRQKMRRSM